MAKVITRDKSIIQMFKINEPYGYAAITKNLLTNELRYEVIEPELSPYDIDLLKTIRSFLFERLDISISELGSEEKAAEYLKKLVREIIRDFKIKVDDATLNKLMYFIVRDYVGYGKIDVMVRDPLIEDISCNGVGLPIYIWHRDYESLPTNVMFSSEEELDSFIVRLAQKTGKMISIANPILDAVLPDGSRIHLTLGRGVTLHGSTFTIRKFKADPLTIVDLIKFNTLSSHMAAIYWLLIEHKMNILVCGPTASGKTTTINSLTCFIKPDAKIVTVEDTPEIRLYHKNWIRSVARPAYGGAPEISLFDLVKDAMRQRPDYIIVGEVRGEEAYVLFQAMATGHGGLSTLHAESVTAAIRRLETEPMKIPRSLVASLNVINVQYRIEVRGKPVRRTITSTEIIGLDPRTNDILLNEMFKYRPEDDSYEFLGRSYYLERIARVTEKTLKEVNEEVARRKTILDWMVKENRRSFSEVSEILRRFYANPEEVFKRAYISLRGA